MGIRDAAHQETAPDARAPVISLLSCSLVGATERVRIAPGTLVHHAYQAETATEQFRCSYGLNPAFRGRFIHSGVRVAGVDRDGEVRAIELAGHPLYVATLYLPQLTSSPGAPHPLIVAYLKAAVRFREHDGPD